MPPEQVILFVIGTIVILFGAYYVTYYVGMKATGQTRVGMRNRNINMIDRYAIARDKQFCIIEIADKVYVIGITNHTMTLLDTIDAAVFAELTKNNDDSMTPWGMTPVGQYGNKLTRKVVEFIATKTGKMQQYKNKSGETDFAESMEEAKRNADDEQDKKDNNINEIIEFEFEDPNEAKTSKTVETSDTRGADGIGKINEIGEINKPADTGEAKDVKED